MTIIPEICRTCLKQVYDHSDFIRLNWIQPHREVSYQQMLESCISSIDLTLTPNAAICNDCLSAVDVINTFKNKCSQTEDRIFAYLQENVSTSSVDLLQVVDWLENIKVNKIHHDRITKSKNVSNLIFPIVIEQEHCYARKTDKGEEQPNNEEQIEISNNWSVLFNNIAMDKENNGKELETSQIGSLIDTNVQNESIKIDFQASEVSKNSGSYFEKSNTRTPNVNKRPLYLQKICSGKGDLIQKEDFNKNKPFKCILCTFTSVSKTMLNDHGKMHTGEKHYKCNFCQYRCNFKSNLQNHMRIHTGKSNPFHCNLCNFSTSSRANLTVHVRTHTGEKPYKCEKCLFRCNNKNRLKFHLIAKHTEETPFKCQLCNYSGKLKSYLVSHMKMHSGEKPNKCTECDYKYTTKTSLRIHKRIHSENKSFECDYKSLNVKALKTNRNVHLGVKLYKCEECEYSCSYYYKLVIHKKKHAKDKLFKCTQCKVICQNQNDLNVHVKNHPVKPYKCKECHYNTYRKNCLDAHIRTHTGEKPYRCVECPYKCSTQSKLTVHMKIHKGIKCYKCTRCKFRFKENCDLKNHMKQHTGRLVRMEFNRKIVPYKP